MWQRALKLKWLARLDLHSLQNHPTCFFGRPGYRGGLSFVEVDEMKAKKKAVKKTAARKPAAKKSPFNVGQRVKVHYGDWGNAKGTVESIGEEVMVLLDVAPRQGPVGFDAGNLIALPGGLVR